MGYKEKLNERQKRREAAVVSPISPSIWDVCSYFFELIFCPSRLRHLKKKKRENLIAVDEDEDEYDDDDDDDDDTWSKLTEKFGRERIRSQDSVVDMHREGKKLIERLNLDSSSLSGKYKYNNLDAIWGPASSPAKIYVGNYTSAKDFNMLKKHGITAIVNCTHAPNQLANVLSDKGISYLNFPICEWQRHVSKEKGDFSVLKYMSGMFSFINSFLNKHESVLIHCLAGAHRAGTAGVASLMYFANMDVTTASVAAKICRSVIDPTIGNLPELLRTFELARLKFTAAATKGLGGGKIGGEIELDNSGVLRVKGTAAAAAAAVSSGRKGRRSSFSGGTVPLKSVLKQFEGGSSGGGSSSNNIQRQRKKSITLIPTF